LSKISNLLTDSLMIKIYTFGFLITFQVDVLAYLDPGTGSMIIQSIIAGVAAGFYFLSTLFSDIKSFIVNKLFRKK